MTDARQALQAQLLRYQAVESLEREHHARMRELLAAPGDPFERERYAPGHFTASAFVLSPDGSELLLIHHDKLDLWLQPGGHIEPSDVDLEHAAAREVREEAGLCDLRLLGHGLFDLDVHRIAARRGALAHEHFDVRFAFCASTRALAAGSDARAARWASLSELRQVATDDSVLRAMRKLRELGYLS